MRKTSSNKILNIKDFSEIAGVSVATVSRVFSGKQTVTKKTKEKILTLADQYGFRPNQVAKSSFGGKTKSIGVLLCRLSCSYFADIAIGIQRELLNVDYLPIVIDLGEDGERIGLKRLVDHRVDGIILSIADQSLTEKEIAEITRFSLPVVTVDGTGYKMAYDNVSSDDRAGSRLAGKYLADYGHRQIGFVCSSSFGSLPMLSRLEGLRSALADNDIVLRDRDIIHLEGNHSNQVKKLVEYLSTPERPTAIYAFNDNDALPVYQAAHQANLRIPTDLSVIGHAGLNFSKVMMPPLTTIQQDGKGIGQKAAQLILERLNNNDMPLRKELHPVSLVERNSVIKI